MLQLDHPDPLRSIATAQSATVERCRNIYLLIQPCQSHRLDFSQAARGETRLTHHHHYSEADVVASALGLIAKSQGAAAKDARIVPGAAATSARIGSVAIHHALRSRQIRIDTARQPRVIPVAHPF